MKYRKKPVVVDAFRLGVDNVPYWFENTLNHGWYPVSDEHGNQFIGCIINTLEGVMTAYSGDYIIRGANGEIYSCKPDIFRKTYDAVNGGAEDVD